MVCDLKTRHLYQFVLNSELVHKSKYHVVHIKQQHKYSGNDHWVVIEKHMQYGCSL